MFLGNSRHLSSTELFKYLNSNHSSRNFIEGEEIVNSGLLALCGRTNVSQKVCEVFALCLQTSSLMGEPHEISGQFSFNNIIIINNFECSCKAGKGGKCKHIAAVLIYFTRKQFCEVELISQTDIKCQWKKQKTGTLSSFKPIPWLNTDCWQKKSKHKVIHLTVEQRESVLHKLLNENPDSALAKHKNRKRKYFTSIKPILSLNFIPNDENYILKQLSSFSLNCQSCCLETYHKLFGAVDVKEILTRTQENETEWHRERQFRITGSRCYEIFTYSRGDWQMKAKKYFWPKRFTNRAMEYGKKTEKVARDTYKSNLKCKIIETGLVISVSNPWLGFSPDGIILGDDDKPVKLLEIKCPVSGQHKSVLEAFKDGDLEYLKIINCRLSLNPKHKYYGQVQMGMCMLNVQTCDFIIYSSKTKTFLNIIVDFDKNFVSNLLTRVRENYFSHMLHEICINSI